MEGSRCDRKEKRRRRKDRQSDNYSKLLDQSQNLKIISIFFLHLSQLITIQYNYNYIQVSGMENKCLLNLGWCVVTVVRVVVVVVVMFGTSTPTSRLTPSCAWVGWSLVASHCFHAVLSEVRARPLPVRAMLSDPP